MPIDAEPQTIVGITYLPFDRRGLRRKIVIKTGDQDPAIHLSFYSCFLDQTNKIAVIELSEGVIIRYPFKGSQHFEFQPLERTA